MSRLTKKQKRTLRQQGVLDENANFTKNFTINEIKPLTEAQQDAFDAWQDDYHLMLHGVAGTGKTFLALYFALSSVLKVNLYKRVHIIRSVVSSREQGFQPGTRAQKEAVFEQPYYPICNDLFGRGDAYNLLKQKAVIDFCTTSFLRGVTFEDAIVVVDEVQNMSAQELHTIMTRVGRNCKIIFCGDIKQDDLTSERKKEHSGLREFMRVINHMKEFEFIEFEVDDIVRSDLVKSYIIAREQLGV